VGERSRAGQRRCRRVRLFGRDPRRSAEVCGITGIFAYGKSEPALNEGLLREMATAMAHRGPDDAGVYLSPDRRVGFGFRRLSIIDLSPAGHQPMSNEDGTVWLVFNGEIYNHAEYRAQLRDRGHVYRGRSDTETIIHLYEEYGEDCVLHLRGMFALAIWDENKRRLFVARDRLGIKPLYYSLVNGAFVFGSEIKPITAYPGVEREVDHEALYHYLTFMIPPAPMTMFKGIKKLPAGHRMTIDGSGTVHEDTYWDAIVAPPQRQYPDDYYSERALSLLREAARMHMISDVPVGAFLSGGLDSSAMVALMAEQSDQKINTFSVGFANYEAYNELEYARQVAKRFGTNHHEVIIDHKQALDYLPELVHSQDEPIADWVCVPLYFVSKLARDAGVIVVQVGEGADELLCGYPRYLANLAVQRLWPWLSKVPPAAWQFGGVIAARARNAGLRPARKIERLMELLAYGDGRFWGGAIVFAPAVKAQLLDTPAWRSNGRFDSAHVLDSLYAAIDRAKPNADPLERMTYFELKQRLPELLLMRVDKITMSTSIEARVPFLDDQFVEFAMGIPMHVKVHNCQTKAVLKRAARDLIPGNIINRSKQGFSAPASEWLRNELAQEVRTSLLDGDMIKRGYLNGKFLQHLLDSHQSGQADYGVQLWNLYNLEMWHRHWIS
jgi:asparagine synthase (glutamine-hydrolysing)